MLLKSKRQQKEGNLMNWRCIGSAKNVQAKTHNLNRLGRKAVVGFLASVLVLVVPLQLALSARPATPGSKKNTSSLTVCSESSWRIRQPAIGATKYQCGKKCGKNWVDCVQESEERDAEGNLLQRFHTIGFVVDGMGGEMRWNLPDPENGIKAGMLIHIGGGGTYWARDLKPDIWRTLERDGLRLIDVKWEPGVYDPRIEISYGWMSRKDENPLTFIEATHRPAAVMRWVHDELIPPELKFGTVGSSGGSIATFSPVYWHGLDDTIDYQILIGGPMLWDLNASCQARQGILPANGLCENDPSVDCAHDDECGPGNKCAYPFLPDNAAVMVDYIVTGTGACFNGEFSSALTEDSYSTAGHEGDTDYDHRVDFVIGEGAGIFDDTLMGLTYVAGKTYLTISSEKTWMDLYPGYHGIGIRESLPDLVCAIRSGLGLEPLCP
jgi:hypothetical protein